MVGADWGRGEALTSVTASSAARYKSVTQKTMATWIRHGAARPSRGGEHGSCVDMCNKRLVELWVASKQVSRQTILFIFFALLAVTNWMLLLKRRNQWRCFQTTITGHRQDACGLFVLKSTADSVKWAQYPHLMPNFVILNSRWIVGAPTIKHPGGFWCAGLI